MRSPHPCVCHEHRAECNCYDLSPSSGRPSLVGPVLIFLLGATLLAASVDIAVWLTTLPASE
jgi:hypothetical protein